ncbi:hypothetical protein ACJ72_06427 [Emergomyces africanus]|uniref:aspartate kinase n=1 Tax=Emergomyces africanus TaxID=1955775 RepID=A0A1B7NR74_9EURO|nr:hypothetical protein ACJ72_06427 [Emergomyces africanus]
MSLQSNKYLFFYFRLLRAAREAAENTQSTHYVSLVDAVRKEHVQVARDLLRNPELKDRLIKAIENECTHILKILEAAQTLGEITAKCVDKVISTGEKLSCCLMAALLQDHGVESEYIDLSDVVSFATSCQSLDQAFYDRLAVALGERIRACGRKVPVITGYFGPVPGGLLDKIGRGYTDLCAALVAVGINAHELQVWKEVDGIFTADPRKVPTARLLSAITPAEAAELTFYGSEVIHPFTMEQVIRARIPIRIKNVMKPKGKGTVIFPDPAELEDKTGLGHDPKLFRTRSSSVLSQQQGPKRPTAVTAKHKILVINVHSNKREVHVSLALHSELPLLNGVGQDEYQIIDEDLRGAIQDLRRYGTVDIIPQMAILSLVGRQMKNMVGIAGRMFSTLGEHNVNIEMISQGASEINISCPETCHVVFVKTVEIQVEAPGTESKFPDMNNDPFTPATSNHARISSTSSPAQPGTLPSTSLSTKPLAPPTPSLIELPTCPVCLERMDETTGLLTIICQHVFHCTCLQKWKGSGCPVCRYTQDEYGKRAAQTFDFDQGPTECQVCHSEVNLWLCLICGNIGCGRYDEAHAFAHFKETSHAFAMDLASQRVWDYVGDGYVHRIIQNKSDGKLVELPAAGESALDPPDWADAVPREKLENMSVEYTHLLTSQLESQRTYFEEVVERAADKASIASAAATAAQEAAEAAAKNLSELQAQYDTLIKETIPNLERDKGRAERRAEKFETMAHRMEKEWREEKAMNGSLMEKVEFLNGEVQKLTATNEDLREQNRDLSFFISGTERLRDQGEDVIEGTVSVPDPEDGNGAARKKKGKGKGKGRK